ncbi:MAG: nucleoside phosphorylase [Thermodesulfobacteriota bacterium]
MPDPCIINPRRSSGEPHLPLRGLLLVNPGEARQAIAMGRDLGGIPAPLFHSNLLLLPPPAPFFIAGPAVGAPMAAMTLEKLIALGAGEVIVVGWAGALQENLRIGDMVVPSGFLSEESTSAHYPVETITPSSRLRALLLSLFAPMEPRTGTVWTTDAPYRETATKIARHRNAGILAVDMESCALAAVARFRAIELAPLLLISDELYHAQWRPGFHGKPFRQRSRATIETLIRQMLTVIPDGPSPGAG